MPIYEYQCNECHHEFEALQKMSDPVLVDCPNCNASSLVKKVSAAAFRLSGSGWYETDFKSGKKKNLSGDAGKSSSGQDRSKNASKDKNTATSLGSATSPKTA